jgi:hypothetical protein
MAGFIPAIHVFLGLKPWFDVIAGLDPANPCFFKELIDARVKPAHDASMYGQRLMPLRSR